MLYSYTNRTLISDLFMNCGFIRKILKYKMYSNFTRILNYKNMKFLRKQMIDRNNYNFYVLNGRIFKIDEKERNKMLFDPLLYHFI